MGRRKSLLRLSTDEQNKKEENKGEESKVIRRTITVDDPINTIIQRIRGLCISKDREVDYTTMANLLMALGIGRLADADNWSEGETNIIMQYLFRTSAQLKLEAQIDRMFDECIKQLPNIMKTVLETGRKAEATQVQNSSAPVAQG